MIFLTSLLVTDVVDHDDDNDVLFVARVNSRMQQVAVNQHRSSNEITTATPTENIQYTGKSNWSDLIQTL